MTKAEEYRDKARECEEHAERTGGSFKLHEVAKKWRLMADHEEKRSR